MKTTTQQANHPRPGSVLIIEPLRSLEDVKKVEGVLSKHPRNLALWKLGINSNLRASDLLALKNSDIDWQRGEIRLRRVLSGGSMTRPRLLTKSTACIFKPSAKPRSKFNLLIVQPY